MNSDSCLGSQNTQEYGSVIPDDYFLCACSCNSIITCTVIQTFVRYCNYQFFRLLIRMVQTFFIYLTRVHFGFMSY